MVSFPILLPAHFTHLLLHILQLRFCALAAACLEILLWCCFSFLVAAAAFAISHVCARLSSCRRSKFLALFAARWPICRCSQCLALFAARWLITVQIWYWYVRLFHLFCFSFLISGTNNYTVLWPIHILNLLNLSSVCPFYLPSLLPLFIFFCSFLFFTFSVAALYRLSSPALQSKCSWRGYLRLWVWFGKGAIK